MGAQSARARALAVLRIRSRATAIALLPAAASVVLLAGGTTGHLTGGGWDVARVVVSAIALVVLIAAAAVALVVARARPAVSPTIPIAEKTAPDLYRLVRDLADRLDVPAPSAIALTPDCDSWLEDRTHPAHGPPARGAQSAAPGRSAADGAGDPKAPAAPVLVIGSPFLWWMRVGELRAVLAPVVAGTGPSAHPDIAAARRFIRGLDAAVAVSSADGRGPVARVVLGGIGRVARLLLTGCRVHAAEMERGVAAAAAERAQAVDYGLRIVAQEQVGLAYAGWDRLLTRVALPAWRMGRWPARLDAGVVAALTELSRRDRLAAQNGTFAARLGERPACDLLEEPGTVDEAASLLAARLFHGGPAERGPDWAPVDWQEYPEEVVDRKWRMDAARLHRVLDTLGVRVPSGGAEGPTLARVLDHLAVAPEERAASEHTPQDSAPDPDPAGSGPGAGLEVAAPSAEALDVVDPDEPPLDPLSATLAAEVAREESARSAEAGPPAGQGGPDGALWDEGALPLFPLQPPRTGRELLADHVTAMVCCAAVDTAGAAPGLDWLDGPSLLVDGERTADLTPRVLSLVEDGDVEPLKDWLTRRGVRAEKPVRLV
ncbi:hypothetical protein [Streptomyces endophyticus]|uniref:Integral membrane protein n=1 Tax=Streptomyces endophyticus TaxID=714166 RepID=A0ABU6FBC6_9ACTN|nr:hypothetical protein [Streptomyces endophyticus]MEB8341332.1 hypothetical protein [Streptomyces endophyticus]